MVLGNSYWSWLILLKEVPTYNQTQPNDMLVTSIPKYWLYNSCHPQPMLRWYPLLSYLFPCGACNLHVCPFSTRTYIPMHLVLLLHRFLAISASLALGHTADILYSSVCFAQDATRTTYIEHTSFTMECTMTHWCLSNLMADWSTDSQQMMISILSWLWIWPRKLTRYLCAWLVFHDGCACGCKMYCTFIYCIRMYVQHTEHSIESCTGVWQLWVWTVFDNVYGIDYSWYTKLTCNETK